MKLASLNNGTRDGALCVVSRDLKIATVAYDVAPSLQAALDDWDYTAPLLGALYEEANRHPEGSRWFELDPAQLAAPLPRLYSWVSAAAYLPYLERMRAALGLAMPEDSRKEPWLTQGRADAVLGPRDDLFIENDDIGLDLAASIAVITGDVPHGVKRERAGEYIQLFLLANEFIAWPQLSRELTKGSGPFHSRIALSLSPVAVTPDELGAAWDGRRVHLPLQTEVNGERLGAPHAGTDMQFDFPALIAAAARTRPLGAGTLLTSGTVANRDSSIGVCSLREKQALQGDGADSAEAALRGGDRVRIDMHDTTQSVFGAIEQTIVTPAQQQAAAAETEAAETAATEEADTTPTE